MGKKVNKNQTNRKKENKKKIKEMEKTMQEENADIGRLIKILCGVIGALVILYLIFGFFHGDLFKKTEKKEEQIEYSALMAGNIFNRGNQDFYVLLYKYDGENDKYCTGLFNVYGYKQKTVTMYRINLSSDLNKSYLTENVGEVNISGADSLKVVDATLLRIKDGKVIESYIGRENISKVESELLK